MSNLPPPQPPPIRRSDGRHELPRVDQFGFGLFMFLSGMGAGAFIAIAGLILAVGGNK